MLEKEEKRSWLFDPDSANELPIALTGYRINAIDKEVLKRDKSVACFDVAKLQMPLTVRRWEKGDWFVPFGMQGRQKLSDYFSDHKYSLVAKEKTWLLCSDNEIIWIIGERADNRFRVGETTKKVLRIKISG